MAGNVVSNVKKYYGGQVPVPGQGDSDGKVKVLVEKTTTMEIEGVQTDVDLLYDADDLTTPVTPQKLGQWTDENYLIVFKTRDADGKVRGFILYALETEHTSTDTLVNNATFVALKGLEIDPGASAFVFTTVEDSVTLSRYLQDENGELTVKFNLSSVEPGEQSGYLSELIGTDSPYMNFEIVRADEDHAYLNLNADNLSDEFEGILERLEFIEGILDELPSDEHGYFNSSLATTPGDGTTTNLVIDNFRISEGRSVHGDNIEFVATHQEGGVDFGEVYLNPGTYILNVHYTLQWVGNPRGTFLPLVANVGEQPFDFSYEHEDILRSTRIVTKTTRGKFGLNFPFDADTPPMGICVKYLEIAQIASYNHPAVTHDSTLEGSGQIGDPLGVTPDAFGKVKDIPTSISQFRTGDVIPVDGPSGTAKMTKDDLLKETAQNALAGNVAPAFKSSNAYAFGEAVMRNGEFYQFVTEHSGEWVASHTVHTDVENLSKEIPGVVAGVSLYTTGTFEKNKSWGVTDLIPVEVGDVVEWSVGTIDSAKALGLYDENKGWLTYYSSNANPRTVTLSTVGVKYVRLCVNLANVESTYLKINGSTVWSVNKDQSNDNVIGFVGAGSSYVEKKYFGKFRRGRTYKLTMLTDSWSATVDASSYKFFVGTYHKNGDRAIGYCAVLGDGTIEKKYIFTIEDTDNIDYLVIAGRAPAGMKVEALVEDVTGRDELRNLVLPTFVNSSRTGLLPDLDNAPTRVTGTSVVVVPYEGVKVDVKGPTNMAVLIAQGNAAATLKVLPMFARMPLSFNFSQAIKCYNIQFGKYSSDGTVTESLNATDVNQMISDGRIQITYEPKDKGVEERNSAQITSVKAAQRKLSANTDNNYLGTIAVFAHISDLHGDGQRLKNAFDFCEKIGSIDGLFCSGDSVMYRHQEGSSWQNKMQSEYFLPFLFCIGNHESWPTGQTKLFEDNIEPLVEKNGYLESSGTATTHCYWYRDYDSKKIRVIALNYYEGGVYNGCLGQAQLTWFAGVLSNTPVGYGVIIMVHSPEDRVVAPAQYSTFHQKRRKWPYQENGFYVGSRPVMQIVDAFIGKTSVSISYSESTGENVSVSADFSSVDESTEFIAYVEGHRHNDWIGYYAHATHRQLSLGVTCGIGIYGDSYNRAWCNESDLPRGGVGPTQDAFNIYGIDRENGVVKVVRVGSNITESLVARERMEIPYRDLTNTVADKTLRFKFSDVSFDPVEAGVGTSGVWEKRTDPEFKALGNVWDWTCMDSSWSAAFIRAFRDESNDVEVIAGNLSGVININELFSTCYALKAVSALDLGDVKYAASAFLGCTGLSAVPLFDLSSIENMAYMFTACLNVEYGAFALYTQVSSQTTPPSIYIDAFKRCGVDTISGSAELAQIPSSWGGLAEG